MFLVTKKEIKNVQGTFCNSSSVFIFLQNFVFVLPIKLRLNFCSSTTLRVFFLNGNSFFLEFFVTRFLIRFIYLVFALRETKWIKNISLKNDFFPRDFFFFPQRNFCNFLVVVFCSTLLELLR